MNNQTLLNDAISCFNQAEVNRLINIVDVTGKRYLIFAMNFNNVDATLALLKHPGVNVNFIAGLQNVNCFHLAVMMDFEDIKQMSEMFDIIADKGVNINHQDKKGETPLHYAIKAANVDIVNKLLELGADPYIVNNKGETAEDYTNRLISYESDRYMLNEYNKILDILQSYQMIKEPDDDSDY